MFPIRLSLMSSLAYQYNVVCEAVSYIFVSYDTTLNRKHKMQTKIIKKNEVTHFG